VSVPYLVSGAIVDTADGPIIFGISREIASHKRMEQEVIVQNSQPSCLTYIRLIE
jgi:hypothetical protein